MGECTKVPRARGPAGAIQQYKLVGAAHWFKTLLLRWGIEMSAARPLHPYHPKWYRKRVSVWWWLESGSYTGFVLRELSAVAVAFFALVLIAQIRALARGPEAYARFTATLRVAGRSCP